MDNGVNNRTDWPALLDEIAYLLGEMHPSNPAEHKPLGTRLLARNVGVSRAILRSWCDGTEPGHEAGETLITHWCRLTGKARTFVPRSAAPLSAARSGGLDFTRSTDTDCTT